jgi:hypothetical protein
MADTQRFRKIKNFQDIKLEKAKLRYEALLAENRLYDDLVAIQNQFTFPVFLSKFKEGFSYASKIYSGIYNVMGWVFRKKSQPGQTESEE